MFKNIGKKIQAVSGTIFVIQSLLGVLFGTAVGGIVGAATDEAGAAVFGALVTIGIFIFLAWLSQLMLYAYGKIAECSEEQCRILRQLVVLQAGAEREKTIGQDPEPGERVCSCGAKLDRDAIFCPECGKRWQAQ